MSAENIGCTPPKTLPEANFALLLLKNGRIVRMFNHTTDQALLAFSKTWNAHERATIISRGPNNEWIETYINQEEVVGVITKVGQ